MGIGEPESHQKASVGSAFSTVDPERDDEARRIRRLQVMMSMVSSVISQDPGLTVEEASELAAGARRAA